MTLPVRELPRSYVEVNGERVDFRSLSRAEGLKLTQDFRDNVEEGEIYVLLCGTGASREEIEAFRNNTETNEAGKLIDGILIFSGLATLDEVDKANDPKPSMNGLSSLEPSMVTSSR